MSVPPTLLQTDVLANGVWPLLTRAMYPDPNRQDRQKWLYRSVPERTVFALRDERTVLCAAGFHVQRDRAEVLHIGTDPRHTGRGYARQLLFGVLESQGFQTLTAQTDDHAVGFYRRCGFQVVPVHSPFGTSRYQATWWRVE